MKELRLCEMTDDGVKVCRDYFAELRLGHQINFPETVLLDPQFSKPVVPEILVGQDRFATKRDAGMYLHHRLKVLDHQRVIGNYPLWSWLGMFYFETMSERNTHGDVLLQRRPDYAHVIDLNDVSQTRDAHAHRLMLSYELFTYHGEKAWWMLEQPVYAYPGLIQRVIRSPERFRSTGVIELVHLLYVDPRTRQVSRRASEQNSGDLPGGLLRLNVILDQLSVNYDVYGMSASQILDLLPDEFEPVTDIADAA